MRLKQYITEESEGEIIKAAESIKRDCQPFLKSIGNDVKNYILFRGFSKKPGVLSKYKTTKDRIPVDVPKDLHKKLDQMFKERFGWKVRSEGTFASGDSFITGSYGYSCLFFPIGNFKFVWSNRVWDMWDELKHRNLLAGKIGGIEKAQSLYTPGLLPQEKMLEDIMNTFTNRDMRKAIKSKNEVTIKCKEYYLSWIYYRGELLEALEEIL